MNKNEVIFQQMMLAVKNGLEYGPLDLQRDMPEFTEEMADQITSRISQSIKFEVEDKVLHQINQNVLSAEQQSKAYLEEIRQEKNKLKELKWDIENKEDELQKTLQKQEQEILKLKPAWWVWFTGYIICSLSVIILAILTFCFLWQVVLGNVWAWFDPMHLEGVSILKMVGFLLVMIISCFIGCVFISTPMLVWDKIKEMRNQY